jgi:transposase
MELHTIGIDLGKTIFHLVGLNAGGEVMVRKKFSRAQLLRFTANRRVHLIGMEACGGAHFRKRRLPTTCTASGCVVTRSLPRTDLSLAEF